MNRASAPNELIVCLILNNAKDSILLLNHNHSAVNALHQQQNLQQRRRPSLSANRFLINNNNINSENGSGINNFSNDDYLYQYWFPYKENAGSHETTSQFIENFITVC
jgi:hypothetical protein